MSAGEQLCAWGRRCFGKEGAEIVDRGLGIDSEETHGITTCSFDSGILDSNTSEADFYLTEEHGALIKRISTPRSPSPHSSTFLSAIPLGRPLLPLNLAFHAFYSPDFQEITSSTSTTSITCSA